MIVLMDNDVLLKLTIYDLFDNALTAFGVTLNKVRVLPTAKYSLPKIWRKYNIDTSTIERLHGIITNVMAIDWMPSAKQIDSLLKITGIDRGEAFLFAAALNATDHCMITTGDKRSLTALANAPDILYTVERIHGQVYCLEQLIKCVIALRGFDSVKERILPNRGCDTAMKAIFGSGMLTEKSNAMQALDSYIIDLRQKTTNILGNEEQLIRKLRRSSSGQ